MTKMYKLVRYEGQPVIIYTDDGREFKGILVKVGEDYIRAIDKCGRIYDFEICHIDALVEPQMKLVSCKSYDSGETCKYCRD